MEGLPMVAVQPYFVFATYQYYKTPVMRNGIAHIYHYHRDCYEFDMISAIPDACVDIFFEKKSSGVQVRACGTVLGFTGLENHREHEYFGIRFMPGTLPANLNVGMKELVCRELELADVAKNKDLAKRIEDARDWRQGIRLFVEDYLASLPNATGFSMDGDQKRLADYIKNMILCTAGNVRICDLAEKTGYTTRYINLLFNQYFGLSPKTFEEIIRFQYAIQMINHHQEEQMANIAMETGYFDQAHFIREFKKYLTITPTEYRTLVREHAYLQRLNVHNSQQVGYLQKQRQASGGLSALRPCMQEQVAGSIL
jgi:AraC-like DNA-binding protein